MARLTIYFRNVMQLFYTSAMQSVGKRVPAKYLPSYIAEARPGIYEGVGLCYVLLVFGFLLWEWLSIGVLASPEKIAEYHFGSEAMLGEGGPNYASAPIYAQSALHDAIFPMLPLVILFTLAAIKNNIFYRTLAWVTLLLTIAGNFLSN